MRTRAQGEIPDDLLTFDPRRWITDAVDHGDSFFPPGLRGLTLAELLEDGYMVRILAAARYREALWASVGQAVGDQHYYGLDPHPGLWPLVRVK